MKRISKLLWGIGLCASAAYADESTTPAPAAFNAQVEASQAFSYDTNPLRLLRNNKSLSGSDTTATLILNDSTPRSQFSLSSEVDQGFYDNSVFNSTNFHEKANAATKTLNWAAHISGKLDYDTTRTSEITTFGINIPSVRHLGLNASPGLDYMPSPDDKISLNSSVTQSTYDNNAFTDYDFYSIAPTYTHHFDPLNTGIFIVNAQRYATKSGLSNTIDTAGPSVGWLRLINPNFTARVTAGAEHSTQDTAGLPSSSRWNYVFSGDMGYKGRSDKANLYVSREQQPFGNGSAALFTTFRISDTHAINENLSAAASASYRYAEYLNNLGVNLDSEVAGSASLAYRVLRNTDVSANYRYIRQTLTNVTGTVQEHIVLVGVTYHPDPWGL